jgi:hypothetical protein
MTNDEEYEDVTIEPDKIEEAHNVIDQMRTHNDDTDEELDTIDVPERFDVAAHKFELSADIPTEQKSSFDANKAFYGVHVVNSNTMRKDNFRHLLDMDLIQIYDHIPTRRHQAVNIRQNNTAEFQMCRSNPEIGGFDRRLQRSVLKREDVDVKQAQSIDDLRKQKKSSSGILGFLKR